MKKTLVWSGVVVLVLLALAACGSGSNSDTSQTAGTLPAPQVRVETQPSATPVPPALAATEEAGQPKETPSNLTVQALPTLDEEQYYQDQIDGLLNKIETKLDNTDTNIKP